MWSGVLYIFFSDKLDGIVSCLFIRENEEYKSAMDSISQFIRDECEQKNNNTYAASKFYENYRHWCYGAGRKPQSQTAFKRSLEKLNGVHQHRSSTGLQWIGIKPCLAF